MNSGFDI